MMDRDNTEIQRHAFTDAISEWLRESGHAVVATDLKFQTGNLYFVLEADRYLGFSDRVWANYHALLVIEFLKRQDVDLWLETFPFVMVIHPRGRDEMILVGSQAEVDKE